MGVVIAGALITGCASTPLNQRVAEWQNGRPYAENIQKAQSSGRLVQSSDVDLVFTIEDFKKELPESAAGIEPVIAVGKTALNVVAEIGNTVSPLYAGAVNSVDVKWAKYCGRGIVADATGCSGDDASVKSELMKMTPEQREELFVKYLDKNITAGDVAPNEGETVEDAVSRVKAETRRDWERFLKIVTTVPDPAVLAQGKAVYERYLTVAEDGSKTLDVIAIEALPFTSEEGKADYNAFLVFRDNDADAQKAYDNALLAKIAAVQAKLQVQMQDLLNSVQALQNDPEVAKLGFMGIAQTLKGVAAGIGAAFADPFSKLGSSISGFSLASDIEEIEKKAQEMQSAEAAKSTHD